MRVLRPASRYYGGKWVLAPFVIANLPPHYLYCEPLGGAASVLLRKSPSACEVYNDLNSGVVNFFRVLRERPDDLARAVRLTPYSREEFRISQEPTDDPLEAARRFAVWSWQGRGKAGVMDKSGWRFMSRPTRGSVPPRDWDISENILAVAERFRYVQIENDTAMRVIPRFDGVQSLFYVDPPYTLAERSKRTRGYANDFTDADHKELADVLHQVAGMVVLSGYPSAMYEKLYSGWKMVTTAARADSGRETVEALWLNQAAVDGRRGMMLL